MTVSECARRANVQPLVTIPGYRNPPETLLLAILARIASNQVSAIIPAQPPVATTDADAVTNFVNCANRLSTRRSQRAALTLATFVTVM